MKFTDSEIIKAGERELIDTIIGDLDWSAIEKIFKERHHLQIQDNVEYRQGDIVVHNDRVAYKLDFDVKLTLSILLDRSGNYVSFTTGGQTMDGETEKHSGGSPDQEPPATFDAAIAVDEVEAGVDANPEKTPADKITQMASQIADMISEINEK